MKTNSSRVLIALTVFVSLSTGCFGKFALTRKVYSWNDQATGSPLVNSVIMWGLLIIPVYELVGLGDILIFNTIEVFTGRNPMAIGKDGTGHLRYAGTDYRFRATALGAIEVSVDGKLALRYQKRGEDIVIEDVRSGSVSAVPMARAYAMARGPQTY